MSSAVAHTTTRTPAEFRLGGSAWFAEHRQFLLRAAIVAVTLLLSAYLAQKPSIIWIAPFAVLAGAIPVWRSGPFGLVVLVVGTLLIPWGIATGTESVVNVAVVLLCVLGIRWILSMLIRRELRLLPSRPMLPLIVLGVDAGIAFLLGSQLGLPLATMAPQRAQIGGLSIYLLSILAFLLMAHQVRDLRWLRWITWSFVAVAMLILLDHSGVIRNSTLNSAYAAVANESIFWLWLFVIAFSQALLNDTLKMRWRVLFSAAVVLLLSYAIVRNRDWNSGWVPEIVAGLVILWLAKPKLAVLATLVGAAALVPRLQDVSGLLINDKNQYDLLTRTAAWDILWKIVAADPVLGTGFANYYFYTPLYPILGWAVKFNSHNNYMDMIVQTGFVGLAIFLWLMFEISRLAWRLRTRVPEGFAKAYTYGALGAIAGTMVAAYMGDWVLPFVYNIGLSGFRASVLGWLFLGGLVVLEQLYLPKSHLEGD